MKILILTEVFFPDIIGGAGRFVYESAKGLVERGHEVYVFSRRINNLAKEETIEGIKIFRIIWSGNLLFFRLFLFFGEVHKIFEILSLKSKFDLVVFNQPLSAFSLAFSKKTKGIAKIYHFQSSWADEFEIKSFLKHRPYLPHIIFKRIILSPLIFLMRAIEKVSISCSDKVIVLSRYTKDRLQCLYDIAEEKIKIIPAGVDTERFKPALNRTKDSLRAELGLPSQGFILFTARNFVPRMGLENLIIAFKMLPGEAADVKLIIAGGGFLEKRLKSLAGSLNLSDKIKFLGQLSEEALIKYYQASDLFILPTQFLEGFGLVTIEALSCGLPVLGTPVGGTIEILSKFDNNFLFSSIDSGSISEKILEFIRNIQDRDLLSKRCRQFILENYSLDKFSSEIEKFYLNLTKKDG